MKYWKIIIPVLFVYMFNFIPSYAQVMMNGTIIGIDNGNVTVTQPIVVDSLVAGSGLTTRATSSDELRTFSFDRVNHVVPYDIGWTGISSSRIDFLILSAGLTDVRTTTNGSQLSGVRLNDITTGFTFSNSLNTIIANDAMTITEFLIGASNGGGTTIINPSQNYAPVQQNVQVQQVVEQGPSNMIVGIIVVIASLIGMLLFVLHKTKRKSGTRKKSIKDFNKSVRGT